MPSATVTLLPHLLEPLCAGPDTAQLVDRYVTPNDRHFVRNHGPVPAIDRSIYRLRIDGLVERRLELGLHELAERFAPHEETVTLQCAGNRRQELHAYRAIEGEVLWVGTDAVQDQKLGPVFPVRIKLNSTETPTSVNGQTGLIKAGMSVTADIRTDQRRLIDYLLAPMLRYKQEALRER